MGAWDDLLRFNNGGGGQMDFQDGNSVYLKPRMGETGLETCMRSNLLQARPIRNIWV